MAEAQAIRNKQYTPNLLSHDVQHAIQDSFRQSNTFSSQAFNTQPAERNTNYHQ